MLLLVLVLLLVLLLLLLVMVFCNYYQHGHHHHHELMSRILSPLQLKVVNLQKLLPTQSMLVFEHSTGLGDNN